MTRRPLSRRASVASAVAGVAAACLGIVVSGGAGVAATTPSSGAVTPQPSGQPNDQPTGQPAEPPEEQSAEDAPEVPKDPLLVRIERLTPSSLPARGKLRVAGTIANRSDEEWSDLGVYLFRSYKPLTTPEELAAAVASDPRTDVGPRVVEPGLFAEVPDLAPGEETSFKLSVPIDQLTLAGEPGVYWVGVHVLGTNSLGRLEGADGRARTFLPLVPERNAGTELALGMQFRNHTVRIPDGRLLYLDEWQETFSAGGRLRRLLDLAATAPGDVSWVLDPALVDAAQSVSMGNPPLELDPAEEPEEPNADPTDEAQEAAGTGEEDSQGSAPELEAEPRAAAEEWVEELVDGADQHSVLALPYGDLDVSSVVRHGLSDLLVSAFSATTGLLEDREVDASPVLLPPTGLLSPSAVEQVDPGLPVVLSHDAVKERGEGPVLNRADGGRVLLAPVAEELWGPGPGAPRAALAVRQRLLADAALHALSGDPPEPLVRFLPPGWDPGHAWRRAGFFEGLEVPWLSTVDVADVLSGFSAPPTQDPAEPTEPIEPAEDIVYPADEAADELPLTTVLSTEALIAEGATVEELITDDSAVDEQVVRQALLTSSFWSRVRPGLAAARAVTAQDRVSEWLDEVAVRGPAFVTMSSETGTFQVTVLNGLDQRVTVGLRVSVPGDDLQLSSPELIELPPNGRGAMRIDATATDIGVHQVSLQPVTADGTPLGEPTTVSIRSSRVGLILWIVMAVGGTALLVAIVLRIWRRVSRRRRTHGPLLQRAEP